MVVLILQETYISEICWNVLILLNSVLSLNNNNYPPIKYVLHVNDCHTIMEKMKT